MKRMSIYQQMHQTGKFVHKISPGVYKVIREVKGYPTRKTYGTYKTLKSAIKAHPTIINNAYKIKRKKVRRVGAWNLF